MITEKEAYDGRCCADGLSRWAVLIGIECSVLVQKVFMYSISHLNSMYHGMASLAVVVMRYIC